MKRIIDGKCYDTEAATVVAANVQGYEDYLDYVDEALYRTANGSWFVAGKGGPKSSYGTAMRGNESPHGEGITPLSDNEAYAWLERHEETEALEKYFAEVIDPA